MYFGYPQAHEDDAQRAVRTGLGILDAMGDLNSVCNETKASNSLYGLGYIRVWWSLGLWAEQGVRSNWHWAKPPTLLPDTRTGCAQYDVDQ